MSSDSRPMVVARPEPARHRLVGVYCNDGPDLRERLPEVATVTLDGIRVVVVHETGQCRGREVRARARWPEADLLLFGHSHIPWTRRRPPREEPNGCHSAR